MLAKSAEADRSEAICDCDDVFYKFDIFEGIFVDVVSKNDGDERGHLPVWSNHCPATNRKRTLGVDALVMKAWIHQSLGIDSVTCRQEEQT